MLNKLKSFYLSNIHPTMVGLSTAIQTFMNYNFFAKKGFNLYNVYSKLFMIILLLPPVFFLALSIVTFNPFLLAFAALSIIPSFMTASVVTGKLFLATVGVLAAATGIQKLLNSLFSTNFSFASNVFGISKNAGTAAANFASLSNKQGQYIPLSAATAQDFIHLSKAQAACDSDTFADKFAQLGAVIGKGLDQFCAQQDQASKAQPRAR